MRVGGETRYSHVLEGPPHKILQSKGINIAITEQKIRYSLIRSSEKTKPYFCKRALLLPKIKYA